MPIGFFEVFAITLVLANAAVSIFLARRPDLDKAQKISQVIIVWLIPIVGAIGLWVLNRSHDDKTGTEPKAFGGGAYERGGIGPGEGGGGGVSGGD